MHTISIDTQQVLQRAHKDTFNGLQTELQSAFHTLTAGKGAGAEFTGWLQLPVTFPTELLGEIEATARRLSAQSEMVVVVGIGGSYLGAKAVLEALGSHFHHFTGDGYPHLVFAGHQLSPGYHAELLKVLDQKEYSVIVISKSGTTTEPAVAFRLLKKHLYAKYGDENGANRIVAITDAAKGALRTMAVKEGYKTFVVPDDIGGRFSVLTPVGLLPLAVAGIPVAGLLEGAAHMRRSILADPENNPASRYALARTAMYRSGKPAEIMVTYEPGLVYLAEWWKQLFGESEGKGGKGIFPASVTNTTDLHSMGQYIQDGLRILFETVVSVEKNKNEVVIPSDPDDLDGLNYLAGRNLGEVNLIAEEATRQAHLDGGVPNMRIILPELTPDTVGQLLYMFEFACGLSAYMLGVNPFDQPGVEAYKQNMFRMLGKINN
ncbi:MAG TPA: glucose-6-phosphate isomerase [Bacteroidales bacterium]|nr:glucose-6-phosphate isomerase [Bacteroidales bacterium]HRZ48403.1 glucose-6-phosphate isomerase [Bacteroidales bacterium]